ncbi:MAG: HEAT repeat domain-containing protein, partial [Myxococcota bacterium]
GARRRAYQALAAIEDSRIPQLLERGLRDSDRSVRGAAALALGEIGADGSLDTLFIAFERGVIEAAIAIGKLGNRQAVERYDGFLGNEPLGVMLSGYGEFLRRRDIPFATKKGIVERLGEVAGVMVRRFLGEYFATLPERTRNREIRELKSLLEETIARIPEEAAGTRIGPQGGQ